MTDFDFSASSVVPVNGFLGKAEPTNPDEMLAHMAETLREISITLEKLAKVLPELK